MASKASNATWWRRGLLMAAPFVAVLIALAAITWLGPQPRLLTDDRGIELPENQVEVRLVLWTSPQPLETVFNSGSEESHPAAAPRGDERYFVRRAEGGHAELYVSYRRAERWTPPIPLSAVNTRHNELSPHLSADGQWLLFCSDRPGGLGGYDLYACQRTRGGWAAPLNLGPSVNSPADEIDPALSPDQSQLCFASNRFAGDRPEDDKEKSAAPLSEQNFDLFGAPLADPPTKSKWPWTPGEARSIEPLNSDAFDAGPCYSPNGDFLYFTSNRSGGEGRLDLYRSRLTRGEPDPPANLGPPLNSPADETDPFLTTEGFGLLFSSNRPDLEAPDSDEALQFDLYRAQSHEVYARLMPRKNPLGDWSWWALAAGLALLVAMAFYIHDGGYRRLDLLKKCLLFSLLLHVLITVLLSLVMVSQQIVEIVAPDAGMTTAVNLDIAREVEIRLQTRQTLTEVPTEAPQLNPTSMQRIVQRRERPQEMPTAVLPPTQRTEGRMVIEPEAPSPWLAHSSEAVAVRELDYFAAAPQPLRQPAQPVSTTEPTARQVDAPAPQPSPSTPPPVAEAKPQVQSVEVEPTQPRLLALLPSESGERPPADRAESFELDATMPEQQPVEVRQTADVEAVTSDQAEWPELAEPATPAQPIAAEPKPEQVTPVDSSASPATDASEQSILVAQAVMPQLDVPAETSEVALPESQVGPRVQVPQLAQIKQDEPPAVPRKPVDSPQTLQPLPTSDQPLAAAEPYTPDLQMLTPLRADEQPLPEQGDELDIEPADLTRAMEPASPILVTYPISADLGPGRLTSPTSLFQRSVMQRQRLLNELGGTRESEEAVGRALRFMSRLQESDGRWTYVENQSEPTGKGRGDHDTAMTGLAALCFLASDHTPDKTGPYQQTVAKALDFLLNVQKSNGDLRDRSNQYGMYCHAIATLALAEAALMTRRQDYRDAALKGAQFIIEAQHEPTGGWRYKPNQEGDTSVFGWQIMALHSCEQLGMKIPSTTLEGAMRWLARVSDTKHGILSGYQNRGANRAMTAEAIFSRILLDEDISPQRRKVAVDYLLGDMPRPKGQKNFYYWYYGSLAMMQLGGPEWQRWNEQARQHLLDIQRKGGPLDGSWDFDSKWGKRGGRIYSTSLATLTCQVYYRYLPMYKNRPIRR